jgi:hypothetical protein
MRRSKVSLCHCFIETSNKYAFGVSPLTARWFEAIAAGCAIVGRRPKGTEVERLFGWKDSTIELPKDKDKWSIFIQALLDDKARLAGVSHRNYLNALQQHDWRYRLRDILGALGVPLPDKLKDELNLLENRAAEIANVAISVS